jgi:hypothetical protein
MGGLFKSKMPAMPPATPMVDEEAVRKAKLKAQLKLRQTGGRESTILSDTGRSDKLGG